MRREARPEIKQFAEDRFAVVCDDILAEYAEQRKQVLGQVRLTGNSGGYLSARVRLEAEHVRKMISARAKAYVEAFTLYGVPSDRQAEQDLQRAAQQIAGGSISGIRGDLQKRSLRLRIAEEGSGVPWHLEIKRAMDAALKKGVLKLRHQRIKFRNSESPLPPKLPTVDRAATPDEKPSPEDANAVTQPGERTSRLPLGRSYSAGPPRLDAYVSERFRVSGGPREWGEREKLHEQFCILAVDFAGTVESCLELLLKVSPHSNGRCVTDLLSALEIEVLKARRKASEDGKKALIQYCSALEQRRAALRKEFAKYGDPAELHATFRVDSQPPQPAESPEPWNAVEEARARAYSWLEAHAAQQMQTKATAAPLQPEQTDPAPSMSISAEEWAQSKSKPIVAMEPTVPPDLSTGGPGDAHIETETPSDEKRVDVADRATKRQAVVNPILKTKRWKRGRLVTESGLGKATVYGYLDGTRRWIIPENRKAMADALGIASETLPE